VGHEVAQLVEAMRYKLEGRGLDSRWCHWNFSSGRTRARGADSASNRNEYQEYFLRGKGGRCVGLTTLAPSRADCHEVCNLSLLKPSGLVHAYNRNCFTLYIYIYNFQVTCLCFFSMQRYFSLVCSTCIILKVDMP